MDPKTKTNTYEFTEFGLVLTLVYLAIKGRLKQSLGALLKANGAATLISYIAHEAKLSCTRLCVATEAIDRISEARNLRYNVTSVGLVDEVTEPPLTDSVQQILEKRQIEHQKRFYETEQFLSSVRLSNNNEQKLRDRLRQKMAIPLANQEKKAVLIRDIIEKDCQVKELIAALEVLQRITGELQTEVKNSTKQHARLKDKQALIASFQSDRQAKQTQICVLMKQNTDAQRKLTDRQRHLLKAISKMASNTEPSASLSSTRIVENMQTEKDELASLSLLSLTKNPHCISASLQCQGKAGPHVAKLKSYLQYLQYKRPEFLVQAALDMKAGVLNGYLVPPKSEIHNEMREATSQLETVVESASVQNEEHTRITVNKLCAGIGETEEGLKKCDQVNVLIDEWWHQPGLKLQLPSK